MRILCFLRYLDILPKDILPKDSLPKDILPKDILPNGRFADGQFDEQTFHQKDISPKGQLDEISEMFGTVTYFIKMFRVVTHYSVNYCVK